MSSGGQKPRKRYFVGEILKQLDVRSVFSIVSPATSPIFIFFVLGNHLQVYRLFIILR
jgi:hypothetical protein